MGRGVTTGVERIERDELILVSNKSFSISSYPGMNSLGVGIMG